MFFLFLRLEHPAGWICARYKSLLLLLLLINITQAINEPQIHEVIKQMPPPFSHEGMFHTIANINLINDMEWEKKVNKQKIKT